VATTKLKHLWKKEAFRTTIAILLVVCVVGGGYLTLQFALGTSVPIRVVGSGSMCTLYDGRCEGLLSVMHPFDQTLHTGDLILIQGVDPKDLNANYPNSDIIVYQNPYSVTPIVHRIVQKHEINGTLYFQTKGDGNPSTIWPNVPNSYEYDHIPDNNGVPQNLVEGRVVMRIPWFGWIALIMQNNSLGLPLVVTVILLLVVMEFLLHAFKKKRIAQQKNKPDSAQMSL
jgi:signal peptidase I